MRKKKDCLAVEQPIAAEKPVVKRGGRLQKINMEIETLTKKRDALLEECSIASYKLDRMLDNFKFFPMLLSAFNALTDKGVVKLEKPEKGTDYWYIIALPTKKCFDVVACQWNDWTSDHYRYCKGNMYLDESVCNNVCQAMNEMLADL